MTVHGVGGIISGDVPSYDVNLKKLIDDSQLYRVIINGYPYVTPKELGFENEEDAYASTKHAIYSIIDGRDVNRYSGVNARGEQVAQAIQDLVYKAKNGTQTYTDPVVDILPTNEAEIDDIDNNYISQIFSINSNLDIQNVSISLDSNDIPEDTIICDINNNEKTIFNKDEKFKILIPRESITTDVLINFEVKANIKTMPIFYGESYNQEYQNYAVVDNPYTISSVYGLLKYSPTGTIKIQKESNDYNEYTQQEANARLENVVFKIKSEAEGYEKELTTDGNGEIIIEGLPLGKYTVQEIKAPNYYLLDNTIYNVEIKHDGDIQVLNIKNYNVVFDEKIPELPKTGA